MPRRVKLKGKEAEAIVIIDAECLAKLKTIYENISKEYHAWLELTRSR